MKMFLEDFKALDMSELLVVNGGYGAVEGSPSAGFGIEIVTEYIFSYGGDIQLRVIDVNNDGKIDYVYKY